MGTEVCFVAAVFWCDTLILFWGVIIMVERKSERPPVRLLSYPKLDFSGIRLKGTKAEYDQIRREIAEFSSKEAILKRLAHMREHPECVLSWDCPYTIDEYERRLLAGEFD